MTNALGIDISHYQAATPSLQGLTFVGVKASEGLVADSAYKKHAAAVRAAGCVLIAYHFARKDVDVVKQADFFVATAPDADGYALDVEGIYAFTNTQISQFNMRMHELGKKIGLYHSRSGFPLAVFQDWNWVALWGSTVPPTIPWTIWQYRGSPLDLDQFNGDANACRSYFGVDMYPIVDATILATPNPRLWRVSAGVTINGYDPAKPNTIVKSDTFDSRSAAHADAEVFVTWVSGTAVPRGGPFLRVTDGTFAGLLIVKSLVSLEAATGGLTPGDVTAAYDKGYTKGRDMEYANQLANAKVQLAIKTP